VQLLDHPSDDPRHWEQMIEGLLAEAAVAPDLVTKGDCLREAALIYERQLADLPSALLSWQAAYAAAPTNDEIAAGIERVADELGCWHIVLPDCEALLTQTTEAVPRAAMLTRMADWQERMVGGENSAEQLLCEAAALLPASVRVAQARSALYLVRGDWANAVDVLIRAGEVAEHQDKVRLFSEAARLVHNRIGDTERAASLYRRVLEVAPDNVAAAEGLSEVTGEAHPAPRPLPGGPGPGGSQEADPALLCEQYRRAHQANPHDLTVIREWADLAFVHERWAEVRLLFDYLYARAGGVTAAVQPDRLTAMNQDLERSVAARQWPAAIDALHALAKDASPAERARYYVAAGKIAQKELGDDTAAIELFGQALAAQPDDFTTLDRLYGILSARQAWSAAEATVRRLIDQLRAAGRGDDAAVMVPLWRRLGEIYRLGLLNHAGAAEAYRECARLAPGDRFVRLAADLIDRHPPAGQPQASSSEPSA
jgi:tetratricopeptide (TPR) repeat protein